MQREGLIVIINNKQTNFGHFTLQANNYNVEITADGVGEEAVDTMSLKLLKTTPGNQAIAAFGGPTST